MAPIADAESDKKWTVLCHADSKLLSTGPSMGMKPHGKWELIADDFTEEDADRYVRMNWKDRYFTEYENAKIDRERGLTPYAEMSEQEFENLFYRMTKTEYWQKCGAVKREEEIEKAKEQAEKQAKQALRNLDCTGLKVLYLYGYGNSAVLAKRAQLKGFEEIFQGAEVEILEGFVQLTERRLMANIEDNNPDLVRMMQQKSMNLYCYAPIEVPPENPETDPTVAYCRTQDLQYAKASKAEMDKAVMKVKEHTINKGGYHMVMGFSCGGEVCAQLVGELASINSQVSIPTTYVGLFGTRCLYAKYGNPLKDVPAGTRVAIVHGKADDEDMIKEAKGDTLYDAELFKKEFNAAGCSTIMCVFHGRHEMPELDLMNDYVYLPMKALLDWQPNSEVVEAN